MFTVEIIGLHVFSVTFLCECNKYEISQKGIRNPITPFSSSAHASIMTMNVLMKTYFIRIAFLLYYMKKKPFILFPPVLKLTMTEHGLEI